MESSEWTWMLWKSHIHILLFCAMTCILPSVFPAGTQVFTSIGIQERTGENQLLCHQLLPISFSGFQLCAHSCLACGTLLTPGIVWLMGLTFGNNFWNVLICFMKHISITHLKCACEGSYTAFLWRGGEAENSHRLVAAQSDVLQGAKSRAGCLSKRQRWSCIPALPRDDTSLL